ncbi:uncharacterized protein LOC129947143 isoform X2 [Eupeodes corollae]|uniref:uncharacterized protein LOC129947143 isoform X2 n=1 Tax=Eupeodes corollae TaxID=290404 RepID=UPI002493A5AA|nr:uncharacterized protein LOC129947143 isoform X2 [Eupeodes corollae]
MAKREKQPNPTCCVTRCINNKLIPDNKERFYRFPVQYKQRRKWIDAVRKINGVNKYWKSWEPNCCTLICCQHFVGRRRSVNPEKIHYAPTIFKTAHQMQKDATRPSKKSFEPNPKIKSKTDKIVVSTATQIIASSLTSTIASNSTPTLTLNSTRTPVTKKYYATWENKPTDADRLQCEFIDYVVISYLNRCRSRAGNPNVGMPEYILKGKALEAEVLLGARLTDPFHWVENFKRKLAEHDAKGIVLSPLPQSLNVADIISDEWPKFAKEKGLDIGEDSEETISAHEEILKPVVPINNEVASQSKNQQATHSSNLPRAIMRPKRVMEETLEDQNQVKNEKHEEFLRHVLMSFIRRFTATWPHAEVPDMVLSAKYREAAIILQTNIKNKSVWLAQLKNTRRHIPDQFPYTVPNQSLDMADIIEVERCKFDFEKLMANEETKLTPEEIEIITSDDTGLTAQEIQINTSEETRLIAEEIEIITSEEPRLTAEEIEIITSEETRLIAEEIEIITSEEPRLTAEEIEIITSGDTTLTAYEDEIITGPNQSLNAIIEDSINEEDEEEDNITLILVEDSEPEEVEDTITSVLSKGSHSEKIVNRKTSALVKESEPEEVHVITSEALSIVDETEETSDLIETYEEALDCLSLLNNYALELGDFNALTLIRQVDSYLRSDDCK